MQEYLKNHNFETHFKKICKRLKGKTIVIYGAGIMFQEIAQNYDLSKLNIIAICDRKYLLEDEKQTAFGYKIVSYPNLNNINADCILIAAQKYFQIEKSLKSSFPNKLIIPFVPLKKKESILNLLNEIPFIKKYILKSNNKFVVIKSNGKKKYNPRIKNLKINFSGNDNYIEIQEPFIIQDEVSISCGSGANVIIGAHSNHKKTKILAGSDNNILIGNGMSTESLEIHCFSAKKQTVKIGNDCQFAWDVIIRTNDAHTLYDIKTREILNPAADVTIGNHVWLTKGVTVMKGAEIPSNCMVGAGSIVNKKFTEENCALAGTPAKIIKRGVNWDRRGVAFFKP